MSTQGLHPALQPGALVNNNGLAGLITLAPAIKMLMSAWDTVVNDKTRAATSICSSTFTTGHAEMHAVAVEMARLANLTPRTCATAKQCLPLRTACSASHLTALDRLRTSRAALGTGSKMDRALSVRDDSAGTWKPRFSKSANNSNHNIPG